MYALLVEESSGTLSVEIYADTPDGGENLLVAYPTGLIANAPARRDRGHDLNKLLLEKGFRMSGPWVNRFGLRAPVERIDTPTPETFALDRKQLEEMVQQLAAWREQHDDPERTPGSWPELVERAEALTALCTWLLEEDCPSVTEFLEEQGLTW
jgi:hypothetical protein